MKSYLIGFGLLDFCDALLNPLTYLYSAIHVDYGSFVRDGVIISVYDHSIEYIYYDYKYNTIRLGRIVRRTFFHASILYCKV